MALLCESSFVGRPHRAGCQALSVMQSQGRASIGCKPSRRSQSIRRGSHPGCGGPINAAWSPRLCDPFAGRALRLAPSDIRQLTLDDINWRGARIDIRQMKTGRPLALPLLPDVADALSAYLRDGRPARRTAPSFYATLHHSNRSLLKTTLWRSCGQHCDAQVFPNEKVAGAFTCFATRWRQGCSLPAGL